MKIIIFIAICLAMASTIEGSGSVSRRFAEVSKLLDAICEVESNGDCSKIGKVGELGCYQIRECFWIDALEHDPSIGGVYEDVIDKEYAEKCILAYWDRYATEKRLDRPVTDKDRARMHNGGPNGHKKTSTIKYWNKIKKELND
jgi:hypothetical protein